jgi:hypothetical protein
MRICTKAKFCNYLQTNIGKISPDGTLYAQNTADREYQKKQFFSASTF